MAVIKNGNGVTYTFSGITLPHQTMTIPGWDREEIDMTNLTNSAVKTKLLGTLREISEFSLTTEFDPDLIDSLPTDNQTMVITFPNAGGAITLWCQLKSVGEITMENDTRPQFELTFTVTNLNGSDVETAPAYA